MKHSYSTIIFIALVIIIAIFAYEAAHNTSTHQHSNSNPSVTNQNNYDTTAPELASAACHMVGELPDPNCTPGAINPAVTQDNIQMTICVSGYTKTIRPPASYTEQLKAQQMQEYGFTDKISSHEEDHLISLELGGAPSDPKNLWPEPHASPNAKDSVENFLHAAVCDGRDTLADAQHRIATNWTTAEQGM